MNGRPTRKSILLKWKSLPCRFILASTTNFSEVQVILLFDGIQREGGIVSPLSQQYLVAQLVILTEPNFMNERLPFLKTKEYFKCKSELRLSGINTYMYIKYV